MCVCVYVVFSIAKSQSMYPLIEWLRSICIYNMYIQLELGRRRKEIYVSKSQLRRSKERETKAKDRRRSENGSQDAEQEKRQLCRSRERVG